MIDILILKDSLNGKGDHELHGAKKRKGRRMNVPKKLFLV